jgi:RimJ/RimL family protein N-acetyltransferase
LSPSFLRASLSKNFAECQRLLPLVLPDEWPGEHANLLACRLKQLEEKPTLKPWLLRAMLLRRTRVMVGHIGFHSAPGADYLKPYSPGAVEFGYTVYPPFRRQGFAREASQSLMDWAFRIHGVLKFVVSIQPDNLPSQNLAAQLGFVRIGSHIDKMDGLEEILEYRVPPPQ